VDACQELLRRYETEGDGFLQRIVTGDESWVHHFQPETKKASKEWRHCILPKPQKFRTQASAGKVMLTLFWDHRGPLVEHYMSKETTVTSATYCDLIRNHFKPAIRSKLRGLLCTGVSLQHYNARPHTAATIEDMRFECLPHPSYSPDLAPSNYHIFGPLKEAHCRKTFRSDEGVQEAVHEWLRTRPKDFFKRNSGIIETLEDMH
jgi:histone-lysine N-methyltransferase SETMAR